MRVARRRSSDDVTRENMGECDSLDVASVTSGGESRGAADTVAADGAGDGAAAEAVAAVGTGRSGGPGGEAGTADGAAVMAAGKGRGMGIGGDGVGTAVRRAG